MSTFTLAISCLTTSNLPWFVGHRNIPGFYAILLFIASDLVSITSHIHNWVLFLLWLRLFLLSGVISPLISSSILGMYWPGEFIFQCPIFLLFHTVHGVLKARILKWFAIPFSVDHFLSELSTMTHSSWVALHGMAHSFTELDKTAVHVINWLVFCHCGFQSVCLLMEKDMRLTEASSWERLRVKRGLVDGRGDAQ